MNQLTNSSGKPFPDIRSKSPEEELLLRIAKSLENIEKILREIQTKTEKITVKSRYE
jgi:hypothetical protein